MILSQPRRQKRTSNGRRFKPPHTTTVVIFGIILAIVMFMIAWSTKGSHTQAFFQQLAHLQRQPLEWLNTAHLPTEYLWFPTIGLVVAVLGITRCSPRSQPWSRTIVIAILWAVTVRYLLWRLLTTLNVADPVNGFFSLGLLFAELMLLAGTCIQLFLVLRHRDQSQRANQMAVAVKNGTYTPTVDVLIPTYNEPLFILERTLVGCQAMTYANKTVFVLDDTNRPEVAALAADLGCQYIARPDHTNAKAGNLNYAIATTTGDLITVFDADFIPTENFLNRTVGFFQNEMMGLVQTPQSFYNSDPVCRNLGWSDVLTPDEEMFYRYIQPIRSSAGSMVCSGTSFVMRRCALEKIGGFVTESVSEDYFTGIRLSALGYEQVYLNEKLSVGLAAENMTTFANQRIRWATGTLQGLFISSNPLTIPGLTWLQRLSHIDGLLHFLNGFTRLFFLAMPFLYAFWGLAPIRFTTADVLYFFVPFYAVQFLAYAWLNGRSRSALLSDLHWLVIALPLSVAVLKVLLRPFGKGFTVSPKGLVNDRVSFNWPLAWPILILGALTAVCFVLNLSSVISSSLAAAPNNQGANLGLFWSSYNLIMIAIALRSLVELPKRDPYHWFKLQWHIHIEGNSEGASISGITTLVSEQGADVTLTTTEPVHIPLHTPIQIKIADERLLLQGQVISQTAEQVHIQFDLGSQQRRRLIQALFCRPGRWQHRQVPGELQALWILFRCLAWPRPLLKLNQGRDLAVAQG
ncbi:MAG: glycosyltransferase [Thermosynechococcaceae cyanobacterium]